ncbi:uncharacterized protein LOC141910730 [Tubulanus polymorphus]|uniref:uncharacterized protein LOC141910730 n=1 Tax=Tubulanus polymorphus TaxID=672921 RepID=UPI003DA43B93
MSMDQNQNTMDQILIRQNIMGKVEIRDSAWNDSYIQVSIHWKTLTVDMKNLVKKNWTIFNGETGRSFVLQIDADEFQSANSFIVLGGVLALVSVILVSSLVAWIIRRHHIRMKKSNTFTKEDIDNDSASHDPLENAIDHDSRHSALAFSDRCVSLTKDTSNRVKFYPSSRHESDTDDSSIRKLGRQKAPSVHSGSGSDPKLARPFSPPAGRGAAHGNVNKMMLASLAIISFVSVVYASCFNYRADVVLEVPRSLSIGAVRVFFNEKLHGKLDTSSWSQKDRVKRDIKVFDIGDASLTTSKPCEPGTNCHIAIQQNLAGCDSKTGMCVCQRGYQLLNGICSDKDECLLGVHECHGRASCENTIGSYTCQCKSGYFGNGYNCQPCSMGCAPGYFVASQCKSTADRVCERCRKCAGSTFEAAQCGLDTKDTLCIHAARPYKYFHQGPWSGWYKPIENNTNYRVYSTEDNVFFENLQSTKDKSVPIYISESQIFTWHRESGMKISIGVNNIKLIPKYEDVAHKGDNEYMNKNPNMSEDKKNFQHAVKNYCRHPIPNYYSITLEIYRDRTTAVQTIRCDAKDKGKERCPYPFVDQDRFTYRTLNQPCQKLSTFPERMIDKVNSVACNQNSPLLHTLFNLTMVQDQDIRFLSKDCTDARTKCQQCMLAIRQSSCRGLKTCCDVNCLYTPSCKKLESPPCKTTPVECAMGDAMRYTIQPVFENLKEEFQCHLKYAMTEELYHINYQVHVDKFGYLSPRQEKVILNKGLKFHENASIDIDFLKVEHATNVPIRDEYILVGHQPEGTEQPAFSLHALKNDSEFDRKPIQAFQFEPNIYVLSAQVSKPFQVSTSNWLNGDGCYRDVKGFHSVQKMYKPDHTQINPDKLQVENVFKYYVKAKNKKPLIRISVPGNQSILYRYFKDKGISLVYDDSLETKLIKDEKIMNWNITIKGQLSRCPGYLGIVIHETITRKQIYHQDALIGCPKKFGFIFSFPAKDFSSDHSFEVLLTDSNTTHKIYLSALYIRSNSSEKMSLEPDSYTNLHSPWPTIVVIIVVFTAILIFLFFVYMYMICTEPKKSDKIIYAESTMNVVTEVEKSRKRLPFRRMNRQNRVSFAIVYGVLRGVYTLMFTFTVFLAIFLAVNQSNLSIVSDFPRFQKNIDDEGKVMLSKMEQYREKELGRQQHFLNSIQSACNVYTTKLSKQLEFDMTRVYREHNNLVYNSSQSIVSHAKKIVGEKMAVFYEDFKKFMDLYNASVSHEFNDMYSKFGQFVKKVDDNGWLKFAHKIHNMSKSFWDTVTPLLEVPTKLSNQEVEFISFLGLHKVDDIQLMETQFWQRYRSLKPSFSLFPENVSTNSMLDYDCRASVEKMSPIESFHFYEFNSDTMTFRSDDNPIPQLAVNVKSSQNSLEYDFDVTVLLYVFIILDALLFLFRVFRTYKTIKIILGGFENCIHIGIEQTEIKSQRISSMDDLQIHKMQNQVIGNRLDKRFQGDILDDSDDIVISAMDSDSAPTVLRTCKQDAPIYMKNEENIVQRNIVLQQQTRGSPRSFIIFFKNVLHGSIWPKILLAIISGLIILLTVVITDKLLTVKVIDSYNGFERYAIAMDINQELTNKYVREQAEHLNSVSMETYKQQMQHELRGLLAVKQNFNHEQAQVFAEYVKEVCDLYTKLLGVSKKMCPLDVSPTFVNMDILPCSFLPIVPKPFSGFNRQSYLEKLQTETESYVTAARDVVFSASYFTLAVLCIAIVFHTLGAVIMYYLRSREYLPVRLYYLLPRAPVGLDCFGRRLPEYRPTSPVRKPIDRSGDEFSENADTHESQV